MARGRGQRERRRGDRGEERVPGLKPLRRRARDRTIDRPPARYLRTRRARPRHPRPSPSSADRPTDTVPQSSRAEHDLQVDRLRAPGRDRPGPVGQPGTARQSWADDAGCLRSLPLLRGERITSLGCTCVSRASPTPDRQVRMSRTSGVRPPEVIHSPSTGSRRRARRLTKPSRQATAEHQAAQSKNVRLTAATAPQPREPPHAHHSSRIPDEPLPRQRNMPGDCRVRISAPRAEQHTGRRGARRSPCPSPSRSPTKLVTPLEQGAGRLRQRKPEAALALASPKTAQCLDDASGKPLATRPDTGPRGHPHLTVFGRRAGLSSVNTLAPRSGTQTHGQTTTLRGCSRNGARPNHRAGDRPVLRLPISMTVDASMS